MDRRKVLGILDIAGCIAVTLTLMFFIIPMVALSPLFHDVVEWWKGIFS